MEKLQKLRNKSEAEWAEKEKTEKGQGIKKERNTVAELTKTALMTAVFCVLAPHTVFLPGNPVGITFATFLLYLTGYLLGPRMGSMSVLLYLLLGMMGLPVFSGYMGGVARLFGPTGGYLLGYIPCVWIVGMLTKGGGSKKKEPVRFVFAALLGTTALYTVGTVWFLLVYTEGTSLSDALLKCVVPFLPMEIVKIVAAAALTGALRRVRQLR
ncbi:MAG: biotin transporter BioY [Lachnospiraceae bacterium]|nr:biotin transporter BioY [Lachnospiraceae bacterium]